MTGVFTWRVSRHCVPAGAIAGSLHKQKGYRNIRVDLRAYKAHRLAWLYVTGAWPIGEIDHRNGVRDDNRFENLRDVGHATNMQNLRGAHRDSRTGVLGVTQRGRRFQASITVKGFEKYLGRHESAAEAGVVYLAAKARHHVDSSVQL